MRICDRDGLEEVACEDYRLAREGYDRLYESHPSSWPSAGVGAQLLDRDQPNSTRIQRRLGATLHAKLGQDATDMRLDRLFTDGQLARHLLVASPAGQEAQHLGLARRQHLRRCFRGANFAQQPLGRPGRKLDLACRRGLDGLDQIVGSRVLEQIADRSGAHGSNH